jgi:hypothetical protein
MLIRNFIKPVDNIDDIDNITERRRFVIIYAYNQALHHTMYEVYGGKIYDLYVLNTSTIIGNDFIIPKGIITQVRNSYRGKVISPFNPDKSFNMNALCFFHNSYYANRIVNGGELLRFTKQDVYENGSLDEYVCRLLKTDTMCPFPNYYNVEDQAHLAKNNYKEFDFGTRFEQAPEYPLSAFRDAKTTYLTLTIETDKVFQEETVLYSLSKYSKVDILTALMQIKEELFYAFIDCYDSIAKSLFAKAYIIFDLEDGLYNVPRESLTLKYSFNISLKEIQNEYIYLLNMIGSIFEKRINPISTDYLDDELFNIQNFPHRISFYISPAKCKIRLSNPFKNTPQAPLSSEYSSSDIDESSIAKCMNEPIFLSEYGINNPKEG